MSNDVLNRDCHIKFLYYQCTGDFYSQFFHSLKELWFSTFNWMHTLAHVVLLQQKPSEKPTTFKHSAKLEHRPAPGNPGLRTKCQLKTLFPLM